MVVFSTDMAIEVGKWLGMAWLAVKAFFNSSGRKADAQLTGTGTPEEPTIRDLVYQGLEAGKKAAHAAEMAAISAARSEDASARTAELAGTWQSALEERDRRFGAHLERIDGRLDLHEKKIDELYEKHGKTETVARAAAHHRRALDVAVVAAQPGAEPELCGRCGSPRLHAIHDAPHGERRAWVTATPSTIINGVSHAFEPRTPAAAAAPEERA